ncbi:uncharacterized protein LOC122849133 [Aphidius gifuensis]|uniref:uncharacterized protein LOC122849133 n=1 Tax=Aphidius gifuensis TaxID=684658 RepID=UPI001CDC3B7A|nr:uncharacterized protein LOC122849133 [Aphidius gifuensis]
MKKIIPVEKYIKSENIVTSNCMPSYEEKVKIVEMAQKNPTWSLEMLRENSGFKKVFYRAHINKWADELKYGGSCREKLKAIDHYVIKKCIEHQKKKVKMSNHHIREWGFEAMSQMNADNINFTAGKSWLGRFKKRYNITGSYTDLKIDNKLCKNTETSFSKIIEPKVNIVKLERKNSIRKPKTTKKTRKENLENKKTDRLKIEVKQEEPQEEDESKEDNNWVYNKCIEYKKNIKGITNILFKKWQRDDEIEVKLNDKSQVNTRSWTSWFNGSK